jgi:hypothetical protein
LGPPLTVGQPISLKARSHSAVAQRSPFLASAMIFSATIAVVAGSLRFLSCRATQAISKATPITCVVSGSKFSPLRNCPIGIVLSLGRSQAGAHWSLSYRGLAEFHADNWKFIHPKAAFNKLTMPD